MKHFIPLAVAACILFGYQTFAQSNNDLINKAKAEMKANEHDGALATLKMAMKGNPNSTELLMMRGDVYMAQLNFKKAVSDYQLVIRLDSQNAEAHFKAGNIFYEEGAKEHSSEKTARGCTYFKKAKELGSKRAASMLLKCP